MAGNSLQLALQEIDRLKLQLDEAGRREEALKLKIEELKTDLEVSQARVVELEKQLEAANPQPLLNYGDLLCPPIEAAKRPINLTFDCSADDLLYFFRSIDEICDGLSNGGANMFKGIRRLYFTPEDPVYVIEVLKSSDSTRLPISTKFMIAKTTGACCAFTAKGRWISISVPGIYVSDGVPCAAGVVNDSELYLGFEAIRTAVDMLNSSDESRWCLGICLLMLNFIDCAKCTTALDGFEAQYMNTLALGYSGNLKKEDMKNIMRDIKRWSMYGQIYVEGGGEMAITGGVVAQVKNPLGLKKILRLLP